MSIELRVWWEEYEQVNSFEEGIALIKDVYKAHPQRPMGIQFKDDNGVWREAYTEEGLSICEVANLHTS